MKNESKRGGKLVGASHAENGIDIITPNGKIEAQGGEVIINAEATKKHCELLSAINQSEGDGVAFDCNNTHEHEEGKTKADKDSKENKIHIRRKGEWPQEGDSKTMAYGGRVGAKNTDKVKWFKDKAGRDRFEIHDTSANLNIDEIIRLAIVSYKEKISITINLKDVLMEWDGYFHYPDLKNINLVLTVRNPADEFVYAYWEDLDLIFINSNYIYHEITNENSERKEGIRSRNLPKHDGAGDEGLQKHISSEFKSDIRRRLFHEIQHPIQKREGIIIYPSEKEAILRLLKQQYKKTEMADSDFKVWIEKTTGRKYEYIASDVYSKIPSEIEANDVQDRAFFTKKQRTEIRPVIEKQTAAKGRVIADDEPKTMAYGGVVGAKNIPEKLFKDKQGRLRFEIHDRTAVFNQDLLIKLSKKCVDEGEIYTCMVGDLLKDWDGYNHYPDLQNIIVVFTFVYKPELFFYAYSQTEDKIYINSTKIYQNEKAIVENSGWRGGIRQGSLSKHDARGTSGTSEGDVRGLWPRKRFKMECKARFLHEIQHPIQKREGIEITDSDLSTILYKLKEASGMTSLSDADFIKWIEEETDEWYMYSVWDYYNSLPSEIEANDVQNRTNYTLSKRNRITPAIAENNKATKGRVIADDEWEYLGFFNEKGILQATIRILKADIGGDRHKRLIDYAVDNKLVIHNIYKDLQHNFNPLTDTYTMADLEEYNKKAKYSTSLRSEKKYKIKSGIVIISKWLPDISLFRHAGIISIENGIPYIYDNDPDNKLNEKGGSVNKVLLSDYLKTKEVLEFYDSNITSDVIQDRAKSLWNKKFNWITFNCETFIEEVTGKKIKRNVLHPIEMIALGALGIAAVTLIAKKGIQTKNENQMEEDEIQEYKQNIINLFKKIGARHNGTFNYAKFNPDGTLDINFDFPTKEEEQAYQSEINNLNNSTIHFKSGGKIQNEMKNNYYYLKIGNVIKEIMYNNFLYITGYDKNGISVKEHSEIKSRQTPVFVMPFDELVQMMDDKKIIIENTVYETDRDKVLLEMEIDNIKSLFKEKEFINKEQSFIDKEKELLDKNEEMIIKKLGKTGEAAKAKKELASKTKGFEDTMAGVSAIITNRDVPKEIDEHVTRKPSEWNDIEEIPSTLVQKHISFFKKLPILEIKKGATPFDNLGVNYKEPFITGVDKKTYLIVPEGYEYARYAGDITSSGSLKEWQRDSKPKAAKGKKITKSHFKLGEAQRLIKLAEDGDKETALNELEEYVNLYQDEYNKEGDIKKFGKPLSEIVQEYIDAKKYINENVGKIVNQYEGKNAHEIWDAWNFNQKKHFLKDHMPYKGSPDRKDIKEYLDGINEHAKLTWESLDMHVQDLISSHTWEGQYKRGGKVPVNSWGTIYIGGIPVRLTLTEEGGRKILDVSFEDLSTIKKLGIKRKDDDMEVPPVVASGFKKEPLKKGQKFTIEKFVKFANWNAGENLYVGSKKKSKGPKRGTTTLSERNYMKKFKKEFNALKDAYPDLTYKQLIAKYKKTK